MVLAHPEGYDVMPEVEEIAKKNAAATGGSYKKVATMEEAFDGADIVYPKSWAPFAAMEQRTKLYAAGDQAGIDALEQRLTGRGTDSPEKIQKRLVRAKVELQTADTYDYFVINDTVENAVREINAIMLAEHCRPSERMEILQ